MVRTFAELYAFELHASPRGFSFNPFNLFTTSSGDGNNNSDTGMVDLVGGCLVAVIGFVTIPLRSRYASKTAPSKERREQERKAERLKWRETLATWPTIYACKRDRTAFLPGEGHGAPARSVFLMLREQSDAAAVTNMLRGG
ncbi:MAG: hypothetical protein QOH49_817 [Acidobacteriota bacterium]|jgi:hypothetical protein|nr:hypothetical protein [Acidobacteriota bacterium]